MLAGAVFFGISVVMVKLLTRTEKRGAHHLLDAHNPDGDGPGAGDLGLAAAPPVEIWPALLARRLYRHLFALLHGPRAGSCGGDGRRADGFPAHAADGAGRLGGLMPSSPTSIPGSAPLLILLGNLFTFRFRKRKTLPTETPLARRSC